TASPQNPTTNATEQIVLRIVFIVVSKKLRGAEPSNAGHPTRIAHQPLTAILGMPRPPVWMATPSASIRGRPTDVDRKCAVRNYRKVTAQPAEINQLAVSTCDQRTGRLL